MKKINKVNMNELYRELMERSAEAVKARPLAFRALKKALTQAEGPVDLSEWEPLAKRISSLLRQLCEVNRGTVFYRAMKEIDPSNYGRAFAFRREIQILWEAIKEVEEYLTK